ncbi:hypothetical protein, partial [Pseudoalteromonas ruthenica]|uniref:hypothetical protein n=1 Tax=Pseudoalteromonas ruthenica TaxID=151081 RepID=UPI0012716C05
TLYLIKTLKGNLPTKTPAPSEVRDRIILKMTLNSSKKRKLSQWNPVLSMLVHLRDSVKVLVLIIKIYSTLHPVSMSKHAKHSRG